jgi:hypothetical protein
VGTITTWLWEIYLQNCVFMYVCMYIWSSFSPRHIFGDIVWNYQEWGGAPVGL